MIAENRLRRRCLPLRLCNSACHLYTATDTHLLPYIHQGFYASIALTSVPCDMRWLQRGIEDILYANDDNQETPIL